MDLEQRNPIARIAGLMALTTPLLLTVDAVSASVSLALTLVMAPVVGVGWLVLARRAWPLLLAMPIAGASMALYGKPGGHEFWSFLFIHITQNSLELSIAVMLRMLAVGLPTVVLLGKIDPTQLGDALSQVLRLPARFVISAVAATRLLSLAQRDWEAMRRAHRARGIGDSNVIKRSLALTFGLLVLSLRRGAKLATAMEARGFGHEERTWARPSRFSLADAALVGTCFAASIAALVVAAASGALRILGA